MEYFIALGGEVVKSLPKRLPVLWLQCCPVQSHNDSILNFTKKTILRVFLKFFSLESAVCGLRDCLNPIFLDAVFLITE
jgi:Ni,Fe-hydrogenase I small subunit